MLDHTKSYIEKIHSIDAELAGHARKLDVKLQSLCGSGFSLFAVHTLAKPYRLGVNWPTTHCEIKEGYISLPLILNAIIGITSYYCIIMKTVILHDGIKTIQNWVFLFSLKKEQNLVYF